MVAVEFFIAVFLHPIMLFYIGIMKLYALKRDSPFPLIKTKHSVIYFLLSVTYRVLQENPK